MSFGEHLDELRKTLIRALIGAGIGVLVGMFFAPSVVSFLNGPLERAIVKFNQKRAAQRILAERGWVEPEVQALLDKRKYTPRAVQVDPRQLVSALRRFNPDFFSGVDLDAWKFTDDQIPAGATGKMVDWLTGGAGRPESTASMLDCLAQRLSSETRDELARAGVDGNARQKAVLRALNELLEDGTLPDDPAFLEAVDPSPDTGWLAGLMNQNAELTPVQQMKAELDRTADPVLARRLNRALITASFAGEVKPVQLSLIPLEIWEDAGGKPQSLGIAEGVMIWMKAGLILGITLAGPWIFYQLWSFVAAGLYPHERKTVHVFLPLSIGLFLIGASFVFIFVFDVILVFFLDVNYSLGIDMQPRSKEWLNFVLFLPVGFGVAFQLPLVMLFLNRINLLSVEAYLSKWRIAIMVIFVIAMILTPAEPVSMLLMGIPLTMLYFLGILLCYLFPGGAVKSDGAFVA